MKTPVYLDYNATTPIDPEVADEMMPFISHYYGNPSSSHSSGIYSKNALEKARGQVAELLNANPGEIIFTSGGTESNNHAIRGIAMAHKGKGKHIITSTIEHPAVTEVCKYLELQGFEVTWLPVDKSGMVNPADVADAVRTGTILITIMYANNETGAIQPVSEIAEIAGSKKIVFHTDASQSAGKIKTDVKELGIDLLTIAGHKLYAPKGVGALYIKQGTKLEILMYGGGQERGVRPGTENIIHIAGLGKACELSRKHLDKRNLHMALMRDRLYNSLKQQLGEMVNVNGDLTNCLPNTLNVSFDGVEGHLIVSMISTDVSVSTGSACHSGATEISPVLKAMNISREQAAGTVRISTGKDTTEEEIDFAVETIVKTVEKLRNNHI